MKEHGKKHKNETIYCVYSQESSSREVTSHWEQNEEEESIMGLGGVAQL